MKKAVVVYFTAFLSFLSFKSLCQKSYHNEKLSQSICHCEECNDVAISNFIDQKEELSKF